MSILEPVLEKLKISKVRDCQRRIDKTFVCIVIVSIFKSIF